jgi:hypothetical protein
MTDRYIDEEGNEHIQMLWEELIPEEVSDIDWDDPNDPYLLKAEARFRKALKQQQEEEEQERVKAEQASRRLSFTKHRLDEYVTFRIRGIAQKTKDWIFRSAEMLWDITHGEISYETVNTLRDSVLEKYDSADSHSKVLSFAKSFLQDLAN